MRSELLKNQSKSKKGAAKTEGTMPTESSNGGDNTVENVDGNVSSDSKKIDAEKTEGEKSR